MKVLKSLCLLVVSAVVVSCGGNASKAAAQVESSQSTMLTANTTGSQSPLVTSPIGISSNGTQITILQTQAVIPGQAFVGFGQIAITPPITVSAQSLTLGFQGFPQILGAPFVAPMVVQVEYLLPGQTTFTTITSATMTPGGQALNASGSFPKGTQFGLVVSGSLNNEHFPNDCLDFCGWQFNLSLN